MPILQESNTSSHKRLRAKFHGISRVGCEFKDAVGCGHELAKFLISLRQHAHNLLSEVMISQRKSPVDINVASTDLVPTNTPDSRRISGILGHHTLRHNSHRANTLGDPRVCRER